MSITACLCWLLDISQRTVPCEAVGPDGRGRVGGCGQWVLHYSEPPAGAAVWGEGWRRGWLAGWRGNLVLLRVAVHRLLEGLGCSGHGLRGGRSRRRGSPTKGRVCAGPCGGGERKWGGPRRACPGCDSCEIGMARAAGRSGGRSSPPDERHRESRRDTCPSCLGKAEECQKGDKERYLGVFPEKVV